MLEHQRPLLLLLLVVSFPLLWLEPHLLRHLLRLRLLRHQHSCSLHLLCVLLCQCLRPLWRPLATYLLWCCVAAWLLPLRLLLLLGLLLQHSLRLLRVPLWLQLALLRLQHRLW